MKNDIQKLNLLNKHVQRTYHVAATILCAFKMFI